MILFSFRKKYLRYNDNKFNFGGMFMRLISKVLEYGAKGIMIGVIGFIGFCLVCAGPAGLVCLGAACFAKAGYDKIKGK